MRLLILNPNTSTGVTDLIAAAARAAAAPGTELTFATATRGVPYIATRTEAAIGGHVALEMLAEHQPEFDAAVIAAFGDPGIGAARELFPQPVIGLAEAGMLTACMMGKRFAIVTFSNALSAWYRECVEWHALTARLAGIFTLTEPFRAIDDVQGEKADRLVALCHEAIALGDADVIVLAGAPLAGFAARVQGRVPVPLVDCVAAAVCQAETLVRIGMTPPSAGGFARPAPKPTAGLSPALADWIEGRAGG
jgi:Asp/Glu/hydantoin racemase